MTPEKKQLRKNITTKFGTIKYFCKVGDYGYGSFKAFLNSPLEHKDQVDEASITCDRLVVNHIDGNITDEIREKIRLCIFKWNDYNPGSYTKFCSKHPEFNMNYLSNIVNGKLKHETPKYKKLIKLLKTEYKLKD